MKWLCAFGFHAEMQDVLEVGASAGDLIAGTGTLYFVGECCRCKRTIEWAESLT